LDPPADLLVTDSGVSVITTTPKRRVGGTVSGDMARWPAAKEAIFGNNYCDKIARQASGLCGCLEFDFGGLSLSEFAAAFDLCVQLGPEEQSEPG
jgi:hypothetical protein